MQILGARSGKIQTISSALNFPFCSFPGIFRKRRKIYFTRFLFSCLAIYISLYFYFLQCQPKSLAIKLILGPSSPPPVSWKIINMRSVLSLRIHLHFHLQCPFGVVTKVLLCCTLFDLFLPFSEFFISSRTSLWMHCKPTYALFN